MAPAALAAGMVLLPCPFVLPGMAAAPFMMIPAKKRLEPFTPKNVSIGGVMQTVAKCNASHLCCTKEQRRVKLLRSRQRPPLPARPELQPACPPSLHVQRQGRHGHRPLQRAAAADEARGVHKHAARHAGGGAAAGGQGAHKGGQAAVSLGLGGCRAGCARVPAAVLLAMQPNPKPRDVAWGSLRPARKATSPPELRIPQAPPRHGQRLAAVKAAGGHPHRLNPPLLLTVVLRVWTAAKQGQGRQAGWHNQDSCQLGITMCKCQASKAG